MSDFQIKTPVLLLIFNRPETTIEVLKGLRLARPTRLFIAADGPRIGHPEDKVLCETTRALTNSIDWPCEVITNFSDKNLGCGLGPAMSISWALEQVEEIIVLEDDCVPNISFFRFCQDLLEKYRNEVKISHINGCNFMLGRHRSENSYYFSRYSLSGGMATWKRAWKNLDFDMTHWQELRTTTWLNDYLKDDKAAWYWSRVFDYTFQQGKSHIWDYQWLFTTWLHQNLCITPTINLISNIGTGSNATHTRRRSKFFGQGTFELQFPLIHPKVVERDVIADQIRQHDLCPSIPYIYAKELIKRLIRSMKL